jgi:hypothetical protein
MDVGDCDEFSHWGLLEEEPADYYRAAATRARKWLAEATTPRLKQQLRELIARCEDAAAKVARASANN